MVETTSWFFRSVLESTPEKSINLTRQSRWRELLGVVSPPLWHSRCFSSSSHPSTKRKGFFGPLDPYLIALLSMIYTLSGPNTASEVATHLCCLQTSNGKEITVLFVPWKCLSALITWLVIAFHSTICCDITDVNLSKMASKALICMEALSLQEKRGKKGKQWPNIRIWLVSYILT